MEKDKIPERVRGVLFGKRHPWRNRMFAESGEGVRHAFSSLPIPGSSSALQTTVEIEQVPEPEVPPSDPSRSA